MDEATRQSPAVTDHRGSPPGIPGAAALVAREGIIFSDLYASHLVEAYRLKVFTAINEAEARRQLESHPEIAFMLIDNRLPDLNGIERDGIGLAIASEYRIPTILVTGGPVFTHNNPLVACVFSFHWQTLEAATRWAVGLVKQLAASRADEALLAAEERARVQQASAELYCELAREVPAPTGFLPYEPDDQRHIRRLSDDSQTGRR